MALIINAFHKTESPALLKHPGADNREAISSFGALGRSGPGWYQSTVSKRNQERPSSLVLRIQSRRETPAWRRNDIEAGAYDRPRDFRYFFVFLSPILDAFFFTVSSDRPSFAAILAVGLFGKSFLSRATSFFDHKPLISFFRAI
jgi:hypothetical protein